MKKEMNLIELFFALLCFVLLVNSSSYEYQEEVSYETTQNENENDNDNDNEMENIEVDEPVIQRIVSVPRSRIKHEMHEDNVDPLYTGDYIEPAPKRKSPAKRQSALQSSDGEF